MPISGELKNAIEKYLNGTASAEELQLVNNWYRKFDDTELIISTDEPGLKEKTDAAIRQRLMQTTGVQLAEETALSRLKPIGLWKWAAAAVIVLVSGAGLYFYKQAAVQQPGPEVMAAGKPDAEPGGNKAILTLADGRQIILNDAKKGTITQQAGINIHKTSDGQLVYEVQDQQDLPGNTGYNTISTPVGGQYQVKLPDGSKVWLNASSTLKFPVVFAKDERVITLSGEGYFEISKRSIPFIVKTSEQEVEVLGTHFNVMAYPDENTVNTTLLEGSVKISHAGSSKLIIPGQQARVKDKIVVVAADTEEAVAWKNGDFKFVNENIQSIMRKISRWYGVDVVYRGNVQHKAFGGTISRLNKASEVLKMLELTGSVHFKIEEGRIIVMP